MKKKNVNTNLVIVLLVLGGLLGYALLAQAGNLEPSAAPAPTMKTLQEVYDVASSGINEREGFVKQLTSSDPNVLTVSAGKEFVILQTLTRDPSRTWNLKIDDIQFLNENIFGHKQISSSSGAAYAGTFNITFPDRCVTVEQGQVLSFEAISAPSITIIGYYYDVP